MVYSLLIIFFSQAGFVDSKLPTATVRPVNFKEAAKRACEKNIEDAKSTYKHVDEGNLPYLCMDLVYQYTLLVDGFGKFALMWNCYSCIVYCRLVVM